MDFAILICAALALVTSMSLGGLSLRNYREDIFEFGRRSCRSIINEDDGLNGKAYFEQILTACFIIAISGMKLFDGELPKKSCFFKVLLLFILLIPVITLIFYIFIDIGDIITSILLLGAIFCLFNYALYDKDDRGIAKYLEAKKRKKREATPPAANADSGKKSLEVTLQISGSGNKSSSAVAAAPSKTPSPAAAAKKPAAATKPAATKPETSATTVPKPAATQPVKPNPTQAPVSSSAVKPGEAKPPSAPKQQSQKL